jgi:hypothetical protein
MIFTDRFSYVHFPKTGGTFVSAVLFRLYDVRWTWFTHLLSSRKKNLVYRRKYGAFVYNNNKHGTCADIPIEHRDKPALISVRNPYDLYVSEFEFGWWKKPENLAYYRTVPGFSDDFGHFPELNFGEYVRLANAAFRRFACFDCSRSSPMGLQSELLVRYTSHNPEKVLQQANEKNVAWGRYKEDMLNVRFIRTNHLNEELHAFLLEMGYSREDLGFILGLGKILPGGRGRKDAQHWRTYYTPELKEEVRRLEWLFFSIFPEFDD